ncbi:pre-rRNA-processing protein IPI1 [Phlyctema vagabunda]|uniref:Pre-rRNA-processing protein n=1 Tax=Phlyctema vagabunda TaxID=108571 RepID=A0ABR4P682_9HELO
MGSSARKKKEKKKDFQKVKLKVGKAKAKADNFTDTSFKAKSIVVNQQSLTTAAPSATVQFLHYVSLASSSHSDTQRRDALSYLATQVASRPVNEAIPVPISVLLPKLTPLILDGSASVRTQLLKLLRLLPPAEIGYHAEKTLLYVRAGMTHLAIDISTDALGVLEWMLEVAEDEVVSCPGGWVKTVKCFMSMMGWTAGISATGWSSASRAHLGKAGKAFPRQLYVFAKFLKAGFAAESVVEAGVDVFNRTMWPLRDTPLLMVPRIPNAYAYLNLFGAPRDEEGEMYAERETRQRVFHKLFQKAVEKGIENAKKAAGESGRAAAVLTKVLKEGMDDYEVVDDTL